MTVKNPVPSPLLPSLADTPQKAQDIQALWQHLYLIYESLGGGDDFVASTMVEAYSRIDTGASNDTKATLYEHTVSADYTTSGDEFVRVSAACTITLNAEPDNREIVKIQPTQDVLVTISGSINGVSTSYLYKSDDLIALEYYVEFDEWVIT